MKHRLAFPHRSTVLAAVLILGTVADLGYLPQAAQAQVPVVNAVVGLANLLSAGARRRGTYIAADRNQQEFNRYYDRLRDTARTQLVSGELSSLRNTQAGLQPSRVGAYVRLDAALRAEQAAVTRAIEAEKNEARLNFNRTVVRTLTNVVISTPGAQQILSQVRTVISNVRASVIALQSAIAAGRPTELIREQLVSQVQSSAEVRNLVRHLGTKAGQQLDQALGGALTRVDNALAQAQQEMATAATGLDEMEAEVAALSTQRSNILPGDRTGLGFNIRVTESTTAVLDAASSAIAFISAIQGSRGTTREQMYQQIRSQILQEHNVALLQAAQTVQSITCTGVGRGEYEVAMGMLGKPPGTVPDPEDAAYIVCTDRETGQPVHAYIVGGGVEATATPGEATPTAEAEIPVGTYTGTTTYPQTIEADSVGTVLENTITVTVDPDGTVTGDLRVIRDRSQVITRFCTVIYHHELTGELGGRLGGSEGHVNLHAMRTGISGHCDGPSEPWADPPIDLVVSIRVIEGVMTGKVIGHEESQEVFFDFSADRQ